MKVNYLPTGWQQHYFSIKNILRKIEDTTSTTNAVYANFYSKLLPPELPPILLPLLI